MTKLIRFVRRATLAGSAVGLAGCALMPPCYECVPEDSAIAQRGYMTAYEYYSYNPDGDAGEDGAGEQGALPVRHIDWPSTGPIWSRTFWVISSEEDEGESGYEPPFD